MKILVVEDDSAVAQIIQDLLSLCHYAVDIAANGEAGLEMAEAFDYSLLVLDVGLPRLDGISLCKQLRTSGLQAPILLLTGQADAHQKAIALNAGADDYMVKPFDAEELTARVQALLRRGGPKSQPVLNWGNLSVDPSSLRVTYGTQLLSLTPKEYAILELLLRSPRIVFSATAILDQAWSSLDSPSEEAIRVHIKELRKKLQQAGAAKDFIKTVYGQGYRLNPAYGEIVLQPDQEVTVPKVAELRALNQELRTTLTTLQRNQVRLNHEHQQLKASYQSLHERQRQICAAHEQLKLNWTAELAESHRQLQQRDRQWQALFDQALDAIAIADDQGRYIDANPAACELFGVPKGELQGLSVAGFIDRELDFEAVWQDFLRSGQMAGEFRVHRPDGTTRDTEFSAIANFVPGRHLSILRDISQRKRSEARLNRLTANIAAMVFQYVRHPDGSDAFTYVSPRCRDIYELEPEAMLQDIDQVWAMVHPEDLEQLKLIVLTSAQQLASFDMEFRLVPPSGTVRWIRAISQPERQPNGDIYWDGLVLDISDRKQAELALQQRIRREQAVADISQDIRRSLSLDHVLSRTVERVRELLNADRVLIFRFRPDWRGDVIKESVEADWLSTLSMTISDPCFSERFIEPYRQGRVHRLADVEQASLIPCYAEFLHQLQVKASLVVPILQSSDLWGLLIAHQCSAPRQWQDAEVDLLRQLATQVSIAIQQSELYERTRRELLERQQMQAVLEASEERFRTLSAEAPIGICQADLNGICLYTNARWQAMSGLSQEDSLGMGWLQAVHPKDRETVATAWHHYLQGGEYPLSEFRLLTPDNAMRWVSARVAAMTSAEEQIIGYVSTFTDITQQKLAEQTIREQAALLDITTDAISVRDLDHRILYWNRGAERLYGWQRAEAIARVSHEILQNEASQLSEIMATLLEQGEWRGEIRKVTKSGQHIIVEGRWTLMRDGAGEPTSILAVDSDITAKKQLEAQFHQARRLESLGRLASGIAHDLNNVFTPILVIAQMLRLTQQDLDALVQDRLRLLEDSARRGADMVKQILTFTRSDQGQQTIVDLVPLLEDVTSIVRQSFPKSINVALELPAANRTSAPNTVRAVPSQLHQVFMNLCINARDAMPAGGRLRLSLEQTFVTEDTAAITWDAEVGSYQVVTIADTGTGIAPEVRDRMFEPFFTTKQPGQGTGLGLATVLGIVKSYGGFLQVFSEIGQGTQIKVHLPAQASQPVEPRPAIECYDGHGERVLIVDDEVSVQRCTQALLESHHYSTLLADNGLSALRLYHQHPDEIDLVVFDVTMPNMSGIELIQRLKAINPVIKAIAISGLPANREPVLAAGANVFLAKPYTSESLLKHAWDLVNDSPDQPR